MLVVLLLAMPMYTCATGSIPLALALVEKGITPGAALVLLMAGPATSIASMLVVGKAFGKRTLVAYLVSIALGAMAFGFVVDTFLMDTFLASMLPHVSDECHGHGAVGVFDYACAVLLAALMIYAKFAHKGCGGHCGCGDHGCCCCEDPSQGANITTYTWGGLGVAGDGPTAAAVLAAKGDVVQPTLLVGNDDNTQQEVTCDAVKAIDSNIPDYEIKVSQGKVTLPAAGDYTVVVSSGGNITQCRMSAQAETQTSITINKKSYTGQYYIPMGSNGVVDNSWCNSSLSVTTTGPITIEASWN